MPGSFDEDGGARSGTHLTHSSSDVNGGWNEGGSTSGDGVDTSSSTHNNDMMMPASFLTEVDAAAAVVPDVTLLLEPVRAEHTKVQAVVTAFGKKVENLLDRQREEYTQAYEFHMFDVQQELHRLRDKAVLIANDTTREEKLKKLQEDEKKFREDAMRLDQETAKCRRILHALSQKIGLAERERDWLLRRLREAKNVLKELIDEHGNAITEMSLSIVSNSSNVRNSAPRGGSANNLTNTNPMSAGALDAASTASATYTLEVLRSRSQQRLFSNEPFPSTAEWKRKLNTGPLLVSRDASILAMDKFLRDVAAGGQAKLAENLLYDDEEEGDAYNQHRTGAKAIRGPEDSQGAPLASLVSIRACHADIRLLLRQCEESAATAQTAAGLAASSAVPVNAAPKSQQNSKRPLPMSSLDSALHKAMKLMETRQSLQMASPEMDENAWRVQYGTLIHELMRLPETYSAITDLLGQAPPPESAAPWFDDEEEEDGGEEHGAEGDGARSLLPPRLIHSLRAAGIHSHHASADTYTGGNGGGSKRTVTDASSDVGERDMDDLAFHSSERFYSDYDKNVYDDLNDDYGEDDE